MPRRTALVVPSPEAEPAVGALRRAYDPFAEAGVPAHITVLFPFAPLQSIDLDELGDLFSGFAAFDYELASLEWWPEPVTYLAPVPAEPFSALTEAVWRRWPEHPPYGGAHETVVPHLTIGMEKLKPKLKLPIRCRAENVLLLAEDEDGRWNERGRFPLQGVE